MQFLRVTKFKETIGDLINYHYAGLDTRRFSGSFFLFEGGIEVCYIKYDEDRYTLPKGVEVISKEVFDRKNDEYYEKMNANRIDYEKKVVDLETLNNGIMMAVAELAMVNEVDKIETQLAIAELATIIMGGME